MLSDLGFEITDAVKEMLDHPADPVSMHTSSLNKLIGTAGKLAALADKPKKDAEAEAFADRFVDNVLRGAGLKW